MFDKLNKLDQFYFESLKSFLVNELNVIFFKNKALVPLKLCQSAIFAQVFIIL
jgi:hypothetical protein